MPDETIQIFTTGGTLDKIYFDAKSQFEVGEPVVGRLLHQAEVRATYVIDEIARKDSLDMTAADRQKLRDRVLQVPHHRIVITHGTDTMTESAAVLTDIVDKTIVFTGALAPARFAETDAMFNLGMAIAAVQVLPAGVYVAMNGRIFDALHVRKDRELNAFVDA